ncbi:hypothetical protein [Pontibacter diazotrophicus]|nr:hypothetical protein [Pontibacter diazotrophicus]
MSTSKINLTSIIYSSAEKHAVNGNKNLMAHDGNQMCPPLKRTGFIKVDESMHKSGGGYAPKSHGVAMDENKSDKKTGASSYSDFILYNYGKANEHSQAPDAGNEP